MDQSLPFQIVLVRINQLVDQNLVHLRSSAIFVTPEVGQDFELRLDDILLDCHLR